MAESNFSRLQQVYGEHILNKVKSCEFHFQELINHRIRQIGDKGLRFQTLPNNLLIALTLTPEAYHATKSSLEQFIEEEEVSIIADWFSWWNECKSSDETCGDDYTGHFIYTLIVVTHTFHYSLILVINLNFPHKILLVS